MRIYENDEEMRKHMKELEKKGIRARTPEEIMKDMTPAEKERFMEERRRKFILPLMGLNEEMLEQKRKELKDKE